MQMSELTAKVGQSAEEALPGFLLPSKRTEVAPTPVVTFAGSRRANSWEMLTVPIGPVQFAEEIC